MNCATLIALRLVRNQLLLMRQEAGIQVPIYDDWQAVGTIPAGLGVRSAKHWPPVKASAPTRVHTSHKVRFTNPGRTIEIM